MMKSCRLLPLSLALLAALLLPIQAAPIKKGACLITVREYEKDWEKRVSSLNVGWHYSWGAERPANYLKDVEFVPMMWGWNGKNEEHNDKRLADVMQQKRAGKTSHLLGFNEPDGKEQANLSVDQCIAAWPKLEKTGLRLGSPAAVHADGDWMKAFMKKADEKKLRVDFVCVHWYGGPNAKSLISKLEQIHKLYGKPIWLTEFCPADWSANKKGKNAHSPEAVKKFMLEVLPKLDELDYVERYAWFTCRDNNLALISSQLIKDDGTLTELGKIYAAHKSK